MAGVHDTTLFAGFAAVAWIGVAGLLRLVAALAETRSAYRRLDEAHFSLEHAREHAEQLVAERDEVITRLEQRNVELTAIQTMLGPLLDIADEHTNGLLRSNPQVPADDLWQWLALSTRTRGAPWAGEAGRWRRWRLPGC